MSADDQQFLDLLSSIPNQVRRYSGDVAEYVDKAVDGAAGHVREALMSASWLPESMRPEAPLPPPPVQMVPLSTYERLQGWIVRHKILSGVFVVAVSYVTYRTVRHTKLLRKTRRAKRARNGSRLEVVVIAGSPTLPLTKSLALDMERKGFIVYIVCSSIEDEVLVQGLSRPDIKPLGIDITDPTSAGSSIERFAAYLQTPHSAVPRAKANYLTLKAVLLIPSLSYQTSPIATIPPSSFADLFNTHLLHPILTIQSFLPLLTSRLTPRQPSPTPPSSHPRHHSHSHDDAPSTPKVLVFTPSIISSINPPFHAPEATVCSALSAFTEVLTSELRPLAIPVTHVQLGTFDFGPFTSHHHAITNPNTTARRTGPNNPNLLPPAETLQWPEAARHAYARNYVAQSSSAISAIPAGRVRGLRGSSLRELHNVVFDVVDGSERACVVRVGLGAGLYGFVGRWFPRSLVAWMMGIRRVDELSTWKSGAVVGGPSEEADSYHGSASGSSGTGTGSEGSENGEASEFIAVAGGANVWKED
ncbi:hypothetical protein DL767_004402 [Monosporascus sp. MG133]|nr:hypothetical protein DL767_004402 [Monosporascus sp. MG133]